MTILIYENIIKDSQSIISLLKNIPISNEIKVIDSFASFKELYEKNNFDLVFLSLDTEDGHQILSLLKKTMPKQKVITMSFGMQNSEPLGCQYCKKHYNIYRAIKPLRSMDIVKIFKNKEQCNTNLCNPNLRSKLLILSKRYDTYILDEKTLTLKEIKSFSSQKLSQKIELTQLFERHNIKFEVLEDCITIVA